MATSKKFAWLVAIGLLVAGGWVQWGPAVDWQLPSIDWLWQQPVSGAVIVVESADQSKYTPDQVAAIMAAPALKVNVADKDVVDRDKKTPAPLVPYLNAAKDKPLPVLVTKRGSSYTVAPLVDEAKLKEALQ